MPRVQNIGSNVDQSCKESGNGSSTYDICRYCHQKLKKDPNGFNDQLTPYNGDPQGTDGWGDAYHYGGSYEDDGYECAICARPLTDAELEP
jgi:hypothetical protein